MNNIVLNTQETWDGIQFQCHSKFDRRTKFKVQRSRQDLDVPLKHQLSRSYAVARWFRLLRPSPFHLQ